jgi:hypothetical protein
MLDVLDFDKTPFIQVASRDSPQARRLSVANGEGELPLVPTEFESQVQTSDHCGSLAFADRSHEELLA